VASKKQVVGRLLCADGKVREFVECRPQRAGGETTSYDLLDTRGVPWYIEKALKQAQTWVQDQENPTKWYVLDESGEVVLTIRTRYQPDALEADWMRYGEACQPVAKRSWAWSGTGRAKSLAEIDRNYAARAMSVASAEAQRRQRGY